MKSISLINPEKAQEVFLNNNWIDPKYYIKGVGPFTEELLVNAATFKSNVLAVSLKVGLGAEYDISLEEYGTEISLELKDIADLGALLFINNEPYLLRVYKQTLENSLMQIGSRFPELRIVDFGSARNENIKTIDGIASCNQLHTLNLDNCSGLNDISKLPQLRGLKTLYLDGFEDATQFHFISECSGLESLSQNSSNLVSIEHLSGLNKLELLSIGGNYYLEDITPIAYLNNLTKLYLNSCSKIANLRPLSSLTRLSDLNLSSTKISDLIHLYNLKTLANLSLDRSENLIDISPLSGLNALTNLSLNSCENLIDISPISGLTALTNLSFNDCENLIDIRPISCIPDLTNLDLNSCSNLTDISPLSSLNALKVLNVNFCRQLKDINPLVGLSSLTNLDLSYCYNLNNISPISSLISLKILDISSCSNLSDLRPLANLKSLTSLTLCNYENLSDLSFLSDLPNLNYLNLEGTSNLNDLSPISYIQSLTNLRLGSCFKLPRLEPIGDLTNLIDLDLGYCDNLPDLGPLEGLSTLQNLNLTSCSSLTRVSKICNLPRLRQLQLNDCPNIRDFDRLANLPQIRDLKWIDPIACNEILMSSAYHRKDVGFVKSRSAQWINELPLSKDVILFTSRLLNCISFLEASERNSLLLDVCRAMRVRGLQSELLNDLDAYTWETWCNLVLELDATQAMDCLHAALKDLDIKRETEVLLGPVIVTASEFIQKHPTEKEKTITWVNEQLLQLENHPEEQRQIAPSAAVFFASLNKKEEVLFWLQKATNEKDPLWREKVLLALVNYYANQSDYTEARRLLDEMQMQEEKDKAIAALAKFMAATHPIDAGFLLDDIHEETISTEAARNMLQQPAMLREPQGIYQLLLHLQSNPDELASTLEKMISKDGNGHLAAAVKQLFLQPQTAGPSATVLLELCKHPSILDFVKPRALEKYKTQLQERALHELSTMVPNLISEMQEEDMIDGEEALELTQLMQHK